MRIKNRKALKKWQLALPQCQYKGYTEERRRNHAMIKSRIPLKSWVSVLEGNDVLE